MAKSQSPRPGIEPGSPTWQAGILTTILPGITYNATAKTFLYSLLFLIKSELYNQCFTTNNTMISRHFKIEISFYANISNWYNHIIIGPSSGIDSNFIFKIIFVLLTSLIAMFDYCFKCQLYCKRKKYNKRFGIWFVKNCSIRWHRREKRKLSNDLIWIRQSTAKNSNVNIKKKVFKVL